MLKLLLFTILMISITFNCVFGQEDVLKGDVKRVTEISYNEVEKSEKILSREVNYESVTYFRSNGKIREQHNLHRLDTTFYTCHYDEGKLVETNYFRIGRDHDKTEIRYNKSGEIKAKIFTDILKDTTVWIENYKYDKNNKLKEVGVTNVNGDLKTLYKYDDAGNKVERYYHWGHVNCKFDSLGREIEKKVYDKNDRLSYKWIQKYEGDYLKEEFSIDPQGNETNRTTYEYSNFDEKGNWLQKKFYEEGEVSGVVIREIEYYSQ